MSNRGRFFIALLTILPLFGSVKATVDDNPVISGERVELKVEAIGERVIFPELSNIGEVNVTTEGSRRLEWFDENRSVVKWVQLYEFTPKKSLTIPPLEVIVDGKRERTKPIFLQVKPNLQVGKRSFRIELVAESDEVYVNQPVAVTVRFMERRETPVMSVDFVPIKYENFWVKRVGKPKRYAKGEYLVHEIEYLFFPQKAGDLKIGPAEVKVATAKKMRDAFGFIVRRPQWATLVSRPVTLHVKPLPKGVNLVGKFTLDVSVSDKEVEAGKPVTLTLKVEARGNIEDFDLPLFKIDGVTVYAQEPKVLQRYAHGIYSGSWGRKFVLIAERSYTIPPFSFKYFDPDEKSVKTVSSEPIFVEVKGGLAPAKEFVAKEKSGMKGERELDYLYLAISFALGMATMYLLLKLYGKRKKREPTLNVGSELGMLQQLLPYVSESKEAAQMAENLYANIFEGRAVKIDKKMYKKLIDSLQKRDLEESL